MKPFLTLKVKKSILKKLTFTKSNFFKSDFLDLAKFSFLNLAKIFDFVILNLNKNRYNYIFSFLF